MTATETAGVERAGGGAMPPRELVLSSTMAEAAEDVAMAVSKGIHVGAFTADTAWLPPDLVAAADIHLTLPRLSGADVAAVAKALCGETPTVVVSDEMAAVVSPRLLRLACRRNQTADAYLAKLIRLIEHDHRDRTDTYAWVADASSASVREAPMLSRLHGMEEAVAWGMAVANDLRDFRAGRISWSAVDRGLLLSGPPGCGKTLFARALAATCEVELVIGGYGEWHGSGSAHQGDLLKAMKKTFKKAHDAAPSILFIDEVDSFQNRGMITHHFVEWDIQIVNALLAEVDGVGGREGVILVAACNHPEKLDLALVRSGRLDRHIRIDLPSRAALAEILREHLGIDLADEDLSGAALAAIGSTGADIERLVRGARRRARSAGRDMLMPDLLAEIGGVDTRTTEDRWLAAIHEAGHAVAASHLFPGAIDAISMLPSGDRGGAVATRLTGSIYMRPADTRDRLILMLAGRAAEHEYFGTASSGAGGDHINDLSRATALAVAADAAYGFAEKRNGLVWRGIPQIHMLPKILASNPRLADSAREMLDEAYFASRQLVRRRLGAVEALARALMARRVLDGPEAEAIVRSHAGVSR
jgi:cell division protease FtsH